MKTEHFELLSAPRGAPDDLAKLHGVGPQVVKKLNDAGVFHYWQIAALTPDEAKKLDQDLKLSGKHRARRLDRAGEEPDCAREYGRIFTEAGAIFMPIGKVHGYARLVELIEG